MWIIIFIVLIIVVGILIVGRTPVDPENDNGMINDNENDEEELVQELLEQLPYETTIEGRTIVFDTESVEQTSREEYARLPYEIDIGDETRLVETQISHEGESPIEFAERFIENNIPPQEELEMYGENMYQYSVSFYEMSEEEASMYPADDGLTDEMAEEGISAYVRLMNLPDDSIGGNENRFDFIVSSTGGWIFVWHGERTFCRRPDQEFWQPANELCP